MRALIPLAALTAAMATFAAAPELSNARASAQDASSSSSSSSTSDSSSSSTASADCPAPVPTLPQRSRKADPTGRTTSSCANPYVKQPGASASSSSSSSSSAPH